MKSGGARMVVLVRQVACPIDVATTAGLHGVSAKKNLRLIHDQSCAYCSYVIYCKNAKIQEIVQ